jgi:hypothetical protein
VVVGRRFPFLEADGSGRTRGQAVAEAVAVVLADQPGFSVDHPDRALVAGLGAKSAAVAFLFVYFYYFTDHCRFLLDLLIRSYYNDHVLYVVFATQCEKLMEDRL